MPQTTFAYKVRDSSGKVLEGTLEADNTSLVASRLRQMGYTPVNIQAKSGNGAMKKELHLPGMGKRVPLKELAVFSRQFATLISSGLTLIRGLTILVEQTEHPALNKVVADVRVQVERGVSLSAALGSHPKVFNRLYVAMVRAGEASGSLDQALLSLADTMEKQVSAAGRNQISDGLPLCRHVHCRRHRCGRAVVHRARLQGYL